MLLGHAVFLPLGRYKLSSGVFRHHAPDDPSEPSVAHVELSLRNALKQLEFGRRPEFLLHAGTNGAMLFEAGWVSLLFSESAQ